MCQAKMYEWKGRADKRITGVREKAINKPRLLMEADMNTRVHWEKAFIIATIMQ